MVHYIIRFKFLILATKDNYVFFLINFVIFLYKILYSKHFKIDLIFKKVDTLLLGYCYKLNIKSTEF